MKLGVQTKEHALNTESLDKAGVALAKSVFKVLSTHLRRQENGNGACGFLERFLDEPAKIKEEVREPEPSQVPNEEEGVGDGAEDDMAKLPIGCLVRTGQVRVKAHRDLLATVMERKAKKIKVRFEEGTPCGEERLFEAQFLTPVPTASPKDKPRDDASPKDKPRDDVGAADKKAEAEQLFGDLTGF